MNVWYLGRRDCPVNERFENDNSINTNIDEEKL